MCLFYQNLLNKNLITRPQENSGSRPENQLSKDMNPLSRNILALVKKRINKRNTRKADKSFYTVSASCTDLYNKCLRFLEHLGVIGTKKAGKINQSIKKERKTIYDITRLLQLIIFPNNLKTLVYGKELHNLHIYQCDSKRYFKTTYFIMHVGKGEVRMSRNHGWDLSKQTKVRKFARERKIGKHQK